MTRRGPRMTRSTTEARISTARGTGVKMPFPAGGCRPLPSAEGRVPYMQCDARSPIMAAGIFQFDNSSPFPTNNLNFVTARGGVAREELLFERSLQTTVTVNPLQVFNGGEVTRKVDIGGTTANAWHSSQGDFLPCVFPKRSVSRWGMRNEGYDENT